MDSHGLEAGAAMGSALAEADAEVSIDDAASILGIAAPLVRRRMDAGVLPFRQAGLDRRLRLADVLALKEREVPVRAALADLAVDTEDLERRYGL